MKLALGADHAGFELKEHLKSFLAGRGHEVTDFGTQSAASTDYPDYAARVGHAVESGAASLGLLVCGTGTGMAIAANKLPGIRAANACSPELARLARGHNDANVLTLGSRFLATEAAEAITLAFLEGQFEGGRHANRVAKIRRLEAGTPP